MDEAHRTQEGDLGRKMREALPNAFLFGMTGTPINRADRNTFYAFGADEDEKGYMSRYGFEESIRDGATLKLHFEPRLIDLHIDKAALDVYGQDGKYYGAPWDMGAVGFWYNKALFAKAGITQTPTTWTDFLQTVKTLQKAGITPLGIGEKEEWPGMYWWAYLAVRLGGKAAFEKAYNRTGAFTDPPFVQAGQHLQELLALHPFQSGFMGASYTDEETVMGNGKAAMELMGQWAPANDASEAADKKGPEFGLFPFPMVEGGAGNPTDVMGGGGGFAVGKNAPPETIDFLKFLTNQQNADTLARKGISMPPIKGADQYLTNPLLKQVVQMVNQAPYFQLYYDQYLPPAVGQVLLDSTEGLFAGTMTPQAAAKAVDDAVASSLS